MLRNQIATNFFTTQFKHDKKSDIRYTAVSKSTNIKAWLEDVANDMIENDKDKYRSIYQAAKEACEKQHNKAEIVRYEIGAQQVIFPLPPNLSVQEIAKELEGNTIEITLEDEDNFFHGCRLKLKPFYVYQSFNIEDASSLNLFSSSFNTMPLPLVVNNIELPPQLSGFKIELDASPRPKCSIS